MEELPAQAPAIATACLYLLFALLALASKFTSGFRLYLLLALSGARECCKPEGLASRSALACKLACCPERALLGCTEQQQRAGSVHPMCRNRRRSLAEPPPVALHAVRGIGWALHAADLDDLSPDKAVDATALVFRQAGFGISLAVLSILAGCW